MTWTRASGCAKAQTSQTNDSSVKFSIAAALFHLRSVSA
jgi:hypothetical protein